MCCGLVSVSHKSVFPTKDHIEQIGIDNFFVFCCYCILLLLFVHNFHSVGTILSNFVFELMLYAQTNFVAIVRVSLVRYNETRRDVLYSLR